jgi:hypothetical protein
MDRLLNNLKLGRGKIKDIERAKFFLDRSFTAQELLITFEMTDEVLRYVLARMAQEIPNLN